VRSAARGGAERAGVSLNIACQHHRRNPRSAGARDRLQRRRIAADGNHAGRSHGDAEQHGSGTIGAGGAGHDKGFTCCEPAAKQPAERNDAATERRKLSGADMIQPLRGGDDFDRHQRVFGEGSVRPVRQNLCRVRA